MKLYQDSLIKNKTKRMGERKSSKYSSAFDVVISDYMISKRNGLEVAEIESPLVDHPYGVIGSG